MNVVEHFFAIVLGGIVLFMIGLLAIGIAQLVQLGLGTFVFVVTISLAILFIAWLLGSLLMELLS